jgi:cation transport regulator
LEFLKLNSLSSFGKRDHHKPLSIMIFISTMENLKMSEQQLGNQISEDQELGNQISEDRGNIEAQQSGDLPSEASNLPEGAQNIFRAAFSSAQHDGFDREGALKVAWNSLKSSFYEGDDGQWHPVPGNTNQHHKAVQSGGN